MYCRVIGRALLDAGARLVIATGCRAERVAEEWRDLRPFLGECNARFVDTRAFSSVGDSQLSAENLVELQRAIGVDATLFIEGDHFESQFVRIGIGRAPRLLGRNCAIFNQTCRWFPGEDPYTGNVDPQSGSRILPTLRRLKRRVLHYRESPEFFFEEILVRRRVLDVIVTKDERVTQRFGAPFCWMPEIYRVFDIQEDERRGDDWERFAGPVQELLARSEAENVLLYFGTGTWYKGYDYFLRLATSDSSILAIHAGAPARKEANKSYSFDVSALRESLLAEGRLFETGCYVSSADLTGLLFGSIRCFVSTHRLTLSSGTMLQALEFGKPVLTPDRGLLGWRTREFGLGMTYGYQDADSLLAEWYAMKQASVDEFKARICSFMRSFSREAVERFFRELLLS